jgi:hypothetical protein
MSNCEIYGFGVGVDIYSSGYIQKYHNVNFGQNGTCVQVRSGGTTYGERIVFDTCVLCNSALAISNNCPTGSLQFVNSSIDYNTKALTATNSSVTEFHQCWLEANDAGASNVMASLASGAQLTMIGGRIQGNGSVGAFAQAGWISTSSDARAVFDNVFIFNQQNTANVFDSGSGVVEFTKTRSYSVCYLPATISASNNNRLADGGFVNATVSDYWSLYLDSGTITTRFAAAGSSLALSATFAHAGTQSLKWSKTASGVNGDFVLAVPVPPGSRVAYTGWLKKPAGASAGNVFISTCAARIEGVGSNGVPNMTINTVFDTSSFGGTVALIDWTKQATGMDRVMPQWATHFVIYFSGNGFAGDLYMDDFNISVM